MYSTDGENVTHYRCFSHNVQNLISKTNVFHIRLRLREKRISTPGIIKDPHFEIKSEDIASLMSIVCTYHLTYHL